MFRPQLLAVSALVLVVSMASSAQAQFPRGMRFPASLQNVFMLRNDAVRKELGVNDEQQALLADLGRQLQQDAFEVLSGLQDLTPEEQEEVMPEVIEMIAERGTAAQGKVDEILDDSQTARLKELSLQSRGAQALEDDEIVAALKITDEQKEKLAEVREEGSQALQEAFQKLRGGGGDQGDIRKKMTELRNKLSDKGLAVLTPDQRQQFEKMKGVKFDFPPRRGFSF